MKLIIKNDYNAMCEWAARHIADTINILNGMAEDLEAECQRYENKIASCE